MYKTFSDAKNNEEKFADVETRSIFSSSFKGEPRHIAEV